MVGDWLRNQPLARATQRGLQRVFGVFRWTASATRATVSAGARERRLLIVYDFSSQPFSVGDILVLQQASLVLRELHGLDVVDFAMVYDPRKPVVSHPAYSHIRPDDFLFHLSSVLPAAQVNPHLGSLHLFDSHARLESFIARNSDAYHVWPSMGLYAAREYLFYHCFNDLFHRYFEERGMMPNLASRPAARDWAEHFIKVHATPGATASVQLRRNALVPARDAKNDDWLEFLTYCAEKYPVKFIVVGTASEIDPRLRVLPNVVIAKDHFTNLEQDLALIEAADFHMGTASGPGTIAQFNRKPYCIFSWKTNPSLFKGLTRDGHRLRFSFSAEFQSWITEEETASSLRSEFERIWAHLERRPC